MYKLLYAPIEEYAGMNGAAYDWEVWGKYDNLHTALFIIMKAVEEDVEDSVHYAYRIVEIDV